MEMDIWNGGYSEADLMGYTIVCWPESQDLMLVEGLEDNAYLINDEYGYDTYGSSAYVVENKWLAEIGCNKLLD